MAQTQDSIFAVVSPGLEKICCQELLAIGIDEPVMVPGGVEFSGNLRELYQANLWLRTASRILIRLGHFTARDFPTLYRRLLRLPWGRFIKPKTPCEVRVSCHRSRLSHSGRVAETAQEAICKALGRQERAGDAVQKIRTRQAYTISVFIKSTLLIATLLWPTRACFCLRAHYDMLRATIYDAELVLVMIAHAVIAYCLPSLKHCNTTVI